MENTQATSGSFVTLTYANAPEVGDYRDFSLFMKRLRKESFPYQPPIRYLAVGEYGAKLGRFHFHALIWNMNQCQEASLTELWRQGFVYTGTVTPASVRYTARYTLKFLEKGKEGMAHWSKRPALGSAYIRSQAAYMRDDPRQRYANVQVPTTVTLEGKTYPLDDTMRREFGREFYQDETWKPSDNSAASHLDYLVDMATGDPVASQRAAIEARNTFYETARFTKHVF